MSKKQYLQIFTYLKEFSKIRSITVRDIETSEALYPEKIWLNDLPDNQEVENILRPNFDINNDYWLKIKKPKEPIKPKFEELSINLENWIDRETLLDEAGGPKLKPTLEIGGTSFSIEDYPEIQEELVQYIEEKWIDDLIEYNNKIKEYEKEYKLFEEVNKVYKKLFLIFNRIQQFGEEFELVSAAGLLNFQQDNNHPKIFRHILTQKSEIIFEQFEKESFIAIKFDSEAVPKFELEYIYDLHQILNIKAIDEAEKIALSTIADKEIESIFAPEIHDAINKFTGRFNNGEATYYHQILRKPDLTYNIPVISYSPCLILRKRNIKNFTKVYEEIIDKINKNNDYIQIPSINSLIEENQISFNQALNDDRVPKTALGTIYFPKEYNKEQIEIIEKATNNRKVLVQGPPGTGKSHTIANLICHLLATGNKVLITAYTKRALEVLKEKLPNEFQELVVNLLGGDSASIQDLQSSVNTINDQLSRADIHNNQRKVADLEMELAIVKESIANITNELVTIKEASTHQLQINKKYQGTLTQIAENIEDDLRKFSWYDDEHTDTENHEILSKTKTFFQKYISFDYNFAQQFKFEIPNLTILPAFEDFVEYITLASEIANNIFHKEPIQCSDFDKLIKNLLELRSLYSDVKRLQIDFSDQIIESYLNGANKEWVGRLLRSSNIIQNLERYDLGKVDRDIMIKYPLGKEFQQFKSDANILIDYIKQGNTLSGLSFTLRKPFLPVQIKQRLYFIDEVTVNGSPCNTIEEFNIVLRDISIKQDLFELSTIWNKEVPSENNLLFGKFLYFKQIHDEVKQLLNLIEIANIKKSNIESVSNLRIKLFNLQQLTDNISLANFSEKHSKFSNYKELVENTKKCLGAENIHQIRDEIISALDNLDSTKYNLLLNNINQLHLKRIEFLNFQTLRSEIDTILPNTLRAIEENSINQNHLENLEEAILCKNAKVKIANLMNLDYERQLFQDLKEFERNEKKLIAEIASLKAWDHVINRLNQNTGLRQHLNAWALAVKKIGKTGKGQKANQFKKIAQKEMEECKNSIPCWIMPLYKVAETMNPEQEMFDYVIIDEASQLGPDAIFLLYLSKNVIIVGDDKQTSPEYIGIEANIMTPFIDRYLNGIRFKEFYGPPFSFFDLATLFCNGITILREHFRCMPEIIEFSNRHFYAPENKALYPLKQYSQNRLKPLVAEYCPNGYIEGSGSNIINRPEANRIVDTICEIIKKDQYQDKTLGVITLQGNRQASLIEDLLIKKIGDKEYTKRKIICGNSSSFQGDERDIIFLSLVTAHNHNRVALVKPEDERRFNVAASRAKEQLWLFHSVPLEGLANTNDLRYKLLSHVKNYSSEEQIFATPIQRQAGSGVPKPFESWFEVDVYNDIVRKNLSVIPQYTVANGRYRIDMVALLSNGAKVAIECDGDRWHGAEQYQYDLQRQKELERIGWQFFRVRGYEYYTNREKALDPLWKLVGNLVEKEPSLIEELSQDDLEIPNMRSEIYENQDDIIIDTKNITSQLPLELPTEKDHETVKNFGNENEIRYFNLFKSGNYIITLDKILNADFVVPIKQIQSKGYLLQCYDSGHINKVNISALLNKKIGKQYINGLNRGANIVHIEVIQDEKIIGIFYTDGRKKIFKAHLTENISSRDLLQLQGIKVIYSTTYENVEYKIFPLEIYGDIQKLVFQSFTATGKALENGYYASEWHVIKEYLKKQNQNLDYDEMNIPNSLFEQKQKVGLNDVVVIKFLQNNKILTVKIVNYPTTGNEIVNGVQMLNYSKPLSVAIRDKTVGDRVYIGDTNNEVEIIEIK